MERHTGWRASQWQQDPDGPQEASKADGGQATPGQSPKGHGLPVIKKSNSKTLHCLCGVEAIRLLHPVHHHGQLRVLGGVHPLSRPGLQ